MKFREYEARTEAPLGIGATSHGGSGGGGGGKNSGVAASARRIAAVAAAIASAGARSFDDWRAARWISANEDSPSRTPGRRSR